MAAEARPSSSASNRAANEVPSPLQEELLSDDELKRCLQDAEDLKQEGNEHFRSKRWNEALASYRSGLGHLPRRKIKRAPQDAQSREVDPSDDLSDNDTGASKGKTTSSGVEADDATTPPEVPEPTVLESECAKARAVLNANVGACYMKLGEHKEVVTACTEALADDPQYVKALQRRAGSNEELNTWTSLSSAQEDYNKLLQLLPASSSQQVEIRRTLQALKPRLEAAQKRETAEMVDKLKGLGNSILGNFGLSTDNFQFVPNGEGGYSMNFVR